MLHGAFQLREFLQLAGNRVPLGAWKTTTLHVCSSIKFPILFYLFFWQLGGLWILQLLSEIIVLVKVIASSSSKTKAGACEDQMYGFVSAGLYAQGMSVLESPAWQYSEFGAL